MLLHFLNIIALGNRQQQKEQHTHNETYSCLVTQSYLAKLCKCLITKEMEIMSSFHVLNFFFRF